MEKVSKKFIIILAFLTAFMLHLLLFSYSPMISLIMAELNVSHVQASLIFSMSILTIAILRIPWGILSDRIGFMKTIKLAMAFIGIFGLLRGFAYDYKSLLITQLLLGVGFASVLPCLAKIVKVMFNEKVGFATGIYVSGFPVGEIVGLGLTSYLLTLSMNWRVILQIFGTLGLGLALTWLLVDVGRQNTDGEGMNILKRDFKYLIKSKEIWILTGICICSMGCYDTVLTWLPHILELKSFSLNEAGFAASMLPLGFLIAGVSVGIASDRLGSRKPFIILLGLIGSLLLLLLVFNLKMLLWIIILLLGFSLSGILTLVLIIPTEHLRIKKFVGSSVGVISSIGNFGSFAFPIITGFLIDKTNSFIASIVFLASVPVLASILGLIIEETGRRMNYTVR
ncbi:MAG: MFS transporter [Candidatus Bathyarchaeia archaeon]